ncbi:MAG: MDR family MFS transporter [Methanobacteriaceae archaeon]|nr:MDR family MFS transporter [Methanobacteriaceae archaeon]MDO9626663.1 MDR family MFS transporter [Methanobacteriaceae archaeon]
MNTESTTTKHDKNLVFIMAGLMVGLLVAALDNSIIGTAMPQIISNLQGMEYYVWPFTSYMLSSTIAIILFGKLSDIYGRKNILILGIVIFVISSIMCGFSTNMMELIIFRGIQGIGGGILIALPFIVVGEIFSPRDRSKYMGILASVFGVSSVLGPILGGVITDTVGWRWIFFVNVPIGIIAIGMLMNSLPDLKLDGVKKVIDYSGIITFTLALSGLFLGLTLAQDLNAYPLVEIIGLFIFSAVMFVLFIWAEKKAIEPILPMYLFKNSTFTISSIENFLASALIFCGIIYVPLFAQGVLGMSATNSGLLMIPMLISLTISANIAGQIISRTGKYKKLAIAEFLITGVGVILLATMNVNTTPYELLAYSTILGLGSGIMYTVFTISVQDAFSNREIGITTAAMQFFRNVGATVAIPIFGFIMNYSMNSSAAFNLSQKEILTLSIQNIFMVSIILAFAGLIIAFFLKEAILSDPNETVEDKMSEEFLENAK